jgi:cytoskeletal protein CcmA (bactofilin family)
MFSKDKSKTKATRIDSLIGQNTHIDGDITFTGGLRVDGSIKGNIQANGDPDALLTLSDKGQVQGQVNVPNVIINGTLYGNLYASAHVELASKAKINGDVYYRLLEMKMGSEVNGQMIRIKTDDDEVLNVSHESNDDDAPFQLENHD